MAFQNTIVPSAPTVLTVPQMGSFQPGTQFVAVPQNMTSSHVIGVQQGVTVQQAGAVVSQTVPQAATGAAGFTIEQAGNNKEGKSFIERIKLFKRGKHNKLYCFTFENLIIYHLLKCTQCFVSFSDCKSSTSTGSWWLATTI